jgi:hypothetical protein
MRDQHTQRHCSQPAPFACLLPPSLPQFGKRLLGEAARRWTHSYIDYKQLKSAIKQDVAAQGKHWQQLLLLLGGSWQLVCRAPAGADRDAMARLVWGCE